MFHFLVCSKVRSATLDFVVRRVIHPPRIADLPPVYLMANNEGHIADFLEEIMDYRKISSRQRRFYM